jgi:dynein heavy chain
MLVGPTGGGKTLNYKMLQHAQTALKNEEGYEHTHVHILNPKAITMDQLYGAMDLATNEWMDGVAAKLVADASKDPTEDKHWVMFDGPVDALWIESMNTVLDDNKKLCLNSGQIIPLSEFMTMMFEVEDLAVASPATVSRCGMVYMEPGAIGIPPLVKSWMEVIPGSFKLRKTCIPLIDTLFKKYLEPCINYMRKNLHEPVATVDCNIAVSFMNMMDCFIQPYFDTELKKVSIEEIEDFELMVEAFFIFSAVWSAGCTTTADGRNKFNVKLREIMGKDNKFKFPNQGTCYDYCFNKETKEWIIWTDTMKPFEIDQKHTYSEIIVPTFDSIRMKYVKKLLVCNGKHVLSPGPTGTGKTVNITNMLN